LADGKASVSPLAKMGYRTQAGLGDILHNERMEYLRPYLHDTGFVPSVVSLFVFYALLRAMRDSMWRIAVLSLPGTIAHELTHLIVGALLLAKPHGFSVWPKALGRSWRLGAVSFGNIGLLRCRLSRTSGLAHVRFSSTSSSARWRRGRTRTCSATSALAPDGPVLDSTTGFGSNRPMLLKNSLERALLVPML
jgi:hypothetical protein